MSFSVVLTESLPHEFRGALLVVLTGEGPLPESLRLLDSRLDGGLARVYATGDFSGKKDETAALYPDGELTRVLLVGLGKAPTRAAWRRGAAVGAKRARILGAGTAGIAVAREYQGDVSATQLYQALAEGAAQGAWFFPDMKRPSDQPKLPLTRVELLSSQADRDAAAAGVRIGEAVGAGHQLARGVQMLPPNLLTPDRLAGEASALAERHGFDIKVLDAAAAEAEGLRALLAVGRGSVNEPRFIALEYRGGSGAPAVLVGKGVTFDTGGISIKPAQSMEDMKYDMSGAAAVLGTFEVLGRLKPPFNVVGLIPSAENMPSGSAYRPADVVTAHFGKTIEVVNTDAEGRLLLVDALSYARRYQPAWVVDIATLTGAIGIALGQTAAGVMGSHPDLVQDVLAAGRDAHERAWELPLWDEYRDLIKSDIADVKNSGGRLAGSITAGWFLREFVEGYPWAHLDIAATAYTDREDATLVRGPTGFGVRLFTELLFRRAGA